MEYPNITSGNWEIATWNDEYYPNGKRISIHADNKAVVVAPRYYGSDSEFPYNIKAISAVPEMINLLINRWRFLDQIRCMPNEELTHSEQIELNNIVNALEKAGCTE